jgi:hypothetical protein
MRLKKIIAQLTVDCASWNSNFSYLDGRFETCLYVQNNLSPPCAPVQYLYRKSEESEILFGFTIIIACMRSEEFTELNGDCGLLGSDISDEPAASIFRTEVIMEAVYYDAVGDD